MFDLINKIDFKTFNINSFFTLTRKHSTEEQQKKQHTFL